jgi:hypothetical protein
MLRTKLSNWNAWPTWSRWYCVSLALPRFGHLEIFEPDLARGGHFEPADTVRESGHARSGRTQDQRKFALLHLKVDGPHCVDHQNAGAIALFQALAWRLVSDVNAFELLN